MLIYFFKKLLLNYQNIQKINNHLINLEDDKQLDYGLIYNQKLVEKEVLKSYIEIDFINRFIVILWVA